MKTVRKHIADSLKLWAFLAGSGLVYFTVGTVTAENITPTSGEQVEIAQTANITPEMMARFERLEAETQRLRREVARLRTEKSVPASTVVELVTQIGKSASVVTTAIPQETAMEAATAMTTEMMTREEVEAYIEKRIADSAWRVGPMKLTPYGRIWASALVSDSRTSPQDAVMYALPSDAYGQTSTAFQARSSRLGLKMEGPDVPFWMFGEMKSSGKVEIDFRNDTGNAENKGSVLLREVYWQLENDNYKILFGQTKDVISPLDTGMLNYYNVWGAGNIGYRNPQLQFTRYYYLNCRTRMEVTSAIAQLCGSDFSANDSPGSYPTFQGRVGWTVARDCNRYPIQFGISGHVGEQRYDWGAESERISTWSANLDLSIPFTERCGIRGEIFHGQGLAGVLGGVGQSIDYQNGQGTRNSIHSSGGWGEFWWDWTDKLHYRLGYGIDNPHDDDMETCNIRENSVIYTNIVYDFTKFLRTGVEYSYWSTDYRDDMPGGNKGRAHVIEWMWQLEF